MNKLDRRVKRTRKSLAAALVDLALESSYDEVSVRQLTQRADIGYATFYRHFKNKDELLLSLFEAAAEDLKKQIAAVESQRAAAELMFEHVRSMPRIYQLYVRLPEANPARQMVRAELEDILHARYKPREGANVPRDVAFNYIIQSATGLLTWYLDNLDDYRPQDVTAMYADLISREATSLSLVRRSRKARQSVNEEADSD